MPSLIPIPGTRTFILNSFSGVAARIHRSRAPLRVYSSTSPKPPYFRRLIDGELVPLGRKRYRLAPSYLLEEALRKAHPDVFQKFLVRSPLDKNLSYINPREHWATTVGPPTVPNNEDVPQQELCQAQDQSDSTAAVPRDDGAAKREVEAAKLDQKSEKKSTLQQDKARLAYPTLQSLTARAIESSFPRRTYSAIELGDLREVVPDPLRRDRDPIMNSQKAPKSKKIFAPSELAYLKTRGYTVADVQAWASLLSSHEIEPELRALSSMMYSDRNQPRKSGLAESPRSQAVCAPQSSNENPSSEAKPSPQVQIHKTPLFVVLFLLRRAIISRACLSYLLEISWYILRHNDTHADNSNQVFLLFVRLLRRARMVWPQGIANITAVLTTFIPPSGKVHVMPGEHALIIGFYNRALRLIAQPTSVRPYLSSVLQESAQFSLLASMAQFDPPLPLTGVGFRAVIQVQLAHRKTEQEKDWAMLKSKSWPPWPVPRTRMDEGKGFEYGRSRAHRTLEWMRSAGYSSQRWKEIALIYAGWETDGTPTIQTRKLLPHTMPRRVRHYEAGLWHAKIQATRTLREAWSYFLSYMDTQLPPHAYVYQAMFQKIIWDYRRANGLLPENDNMLPGEGKETIAPPTSPMETMYLPSEPPDFFQFFWQMRNAGVIPRRKFLGMLLEWSPSMDDAITILRATSESPLENTLIASASARSEMNNDVFHSFVHVCGQFPSSPKLLPFFTPQQLEDLRETLTSNGISHVHGEAENCAVFHAYHLAVTRRCVQGTVWNNILSGVEILSRPHNLYHEYHSIVLHILETMETLSVELDDSGFRIYCKFLRHFAEWAHQELYRKHHQSSNVKQEIRAQRAYHVLSGSEAEMLQEAFYKLVGPNTDDPAPLERTDSGIPPIPRLLATPSPATCHYYVRALGCLNAHEHICRFVKWIAANESELCWLVDEEMGGRRRWRNVLVAIRLYLEGRAVIHIDPFSRLATHAKLPMADNDQIALAKETLQNMDSLGGWASDDEIEEYLRIGRENRSDHNG